MRNLRVFAGQIVSLLGSLDGRTTAEFFFCEALFKPVDTFSLHIHIVLPDSSGLISGEDSITA
jgi:hypothetical protein